MTINGNMYSFDRTVADMRRLGMKLAADKIELKVPDAKTVLEDAFRYFMAGNKQQMKWLPEYDKIAAWLANNEGRGLFMYGDCGRGKSMLCRFVLPAILLQYCHKVVSVFDIQDMNRNIDTALNKRIISLDDIGTEEQSVRYGERRMAFSEIMDVAEKNNNLVIISTNLTSDNIRSQYGARVLERIVATTTRVMFEGPSLRR